MKYNTVVVYGDKQSSYLWVLYVFVNLEKNELFNKDRKT